MNGLLGMSLRHSQSPRLHALFGDEDYRLFEVPPSELEGFLRADVFDGCNVTIPYKRAVVPYCTELSPVARAIGAVNTLIRRADGTLFGDNTDFDGFLWLLRRNFTPACGETALILGTGGAAVTVKAALEAQGMRTVLVSRHGENNYVNLFDYADAVLLVNATPVGMYPNNGEQLVDLRRLPNLRCVLDLVYNPLKTGLLLQAEKLGLDCEGGLAMLVEQGRRAAELFQCRSIPAARSEEVLCKLKSEMESIILIGMPASGKTTIGRALAAKLGRPFVDADEEFARRIGCSCAEFLMEQGETAFRTAETHVLTDLGKRGGIVLATGGGCVTRAENDPILHQNGRIVWLLRDLSLLRTDGRPLSIARPLSQLFAEREEQYRRFADIMIENNGTVDACVRALAEEL